MRSSPGVPVLLLLAVTVAVTTVPASITARAAPTVSAVPVAVVAPAASAAPNPVAAGAAVAGAAVVRAEPAQWTWPVDPPQLLRQFEAPASRYSSGHRGIDLSAQPGAPVRSPADGVVSFAGVVVDRPVLSIQHDGGLVSSFEPLTVTVATGDRVRAGQAVGVVATGAHCDQRCLHLGVRRHGQYISPMLFFGGVDPAVLLPLGGASARIR